ncbi:MFS transporter [Aliikangiella coralliicola]|uniref:MFS transporter n=1 Tax=Aliikangiella coralliicola TaxID=2592383 RepID=A0A545UGP8_9GAMM|nr:MFS transporter [Aliikangiella coralliicola]TQV88648.1 MFS transporter [Aliikangiella coralliicola]
MEKVQARLILATIMLVSLLGTAGIALPYPILSPYFMSGGDDPLINFGGIDPKILLGIALATYPLGILIGSNIIGSLSDRYGRKSILIYSLIGSILGYLVTGWAIQQSSFIGFITARLITGFCEGNISVARAIAVELHPHIDRGRSLSLLYATVYGGWLVGPLAGGYLMPYGIETPFYIAAIAVLLSLILVFFTLPDQPPQKRSTLPLWQEIKSNHSATLLKIPAIRHFFIYYFIYTLGINAYYEFYPLWLVESYSFNSKEIAWITVAITLLMVLVSSTIAEKIPKKIGEKKALLGGNLIFAGLIIVATFLDAESVYLPLALTGAVIAVINIVFPAMLSEYFGHHGQGKIMGLQVSVFCFTNVVIAIGGSIVALISATTTLWLAAALIVLSVFLFQTPEKQLKNSTVEA